MRYASSHNQRVTIAGLSCDVDRRFLALTAATFVLTFALFWFWFAPAGPAVAPVAESAPPATPASPPAATPPPSVSPDSPPAPPSYTPPPDPTGVHRLG